MAIKLAVDYGYRKPKMFVDDKYCVKTKEEVKQILDNCARIVMEDYVAQQRKRLDSQSEAEQ